MYKLHIVESFFAKRRISLSEELTKTRAAEIGITTIITAKITLLKKALNDGVIKLTIYSKFKF